MNCDTSAQLNSSCDAWDSDCQLGSDVRAGSPGEAHESLPAFVFDVLNELSSAELRERLRSLLIDNSRAITSCHENYAKATEELAATRKKMSLLELELGDVRSAAALVIANQEEAFSTLKRRYEDELASVQSVFNHTVADTRTTERVKWENERDLLLTELALTKCAPVNPKSDHPRLSACPLNADASGQLTVTCTPVSPTSGDITDSGQIQTTSPTTNPSTETTIIARYENEIARLRRMLEDFRLRYDLGLSEEGLNTNVPCSDNPKSPSASEHIEEITQTEPTNSVCLLTGAGPENGANTVTELDWLHLQSIKKDIVVHSSESCAMCSNYEHLLQIAQTEQKRLEQAVEARNRELQEKTADLENASQRQSELEQLLLTRSAAQLEQINRLESSLGAVQSQLESVLSQYTDHKSAVERELHQLNADSKLVQTRYQALQSHYDALLGRRSRAAAELIAQPILLPSDKSDLELLALKLHEENICLREAREHLDDRLEDSSRFYEIQVADVKQKEKNARLSLQRELEETKARLASLTDTVQERDKEAFARSQAEAEAALLSRQIEELQAKFDVSQSELANARAEAADWQQRLVCLQTDLNKTESVQADFVRLSQSLQMQLEQLRQQEHEVRWVDPDEARDCFSCHTVLPVGGSSQRKANCRHCGKVHCPNCLTHTFPSALSGRLVPVCDVCHTLLNKHAAPYFSTGSQDRSSTPRRRSADSPGRPSAAGPLRSANSPLADRSNS